VEHPFLGPDCRILVDTVWPDDQAHATRAAEALTRAGFDISLDPMLLSRQALDTDHAERLRRQQAAATRTSPPRARKPPPTPLLQNPSTPHLPPRMARAAPARSNPDDLQKNPPQHRPTDRSSPPDPLDSAMPSPRTRAPSTTTGTDALLYLLFGVLAATLAFGSLAWLTGNLTNTAVGQGPWAPFQATDALLHPQALWPHLSSTALLISARVIPGLLALSLLAASGALWLRIRGAANGLARKADLAPLMGKEITAKARTLRPSLADRERKRGRTC
jgi:hypothetical protein